MLIVVLFSFALLLPPHVYATDWYISPSGSDSKGRGTMFSPFATLAKAATVASTGDAIVAMPGTYSDDHIINVPADISIIAQEGSGSVIFQDYTTLKPLGTVNVSGIVFENGCFDLIGSNDSNIHYFISECQFIGGACTQTISFYIYSEFVLTIQDCYFTGSAWSVFINHKASVTVLKSTFIGGMGGIGFFAGGTLIVDDSDFINISPSRTKAVIMAYNANVTVTSSRFANSNGSYIGSAISVYQSSNLSVMASVFSNNHVVDDGGAIYLGPGTFSTFAACEFVGNYAGGAGGAVYAYGDSYASFEGCLFANNWAPTGGAYSCGNEGTIEVSGCKFVNSTVDNINCRS